MSFHTPSSVHVSQVNLNVSSIESALPFYTDLLGFSILEENDRMVHLTVDGQTSFLTLNVPVLPIEKKKTAGLYHFAILLAEKSELAALVIHLAHNNIQLGAADHGVSEAVYFNDPDGNGIEVYVDRNPETWTWSGGNVQMVTDPLDFDGLAKTLKSDQKWRKMPTSTVMGHLHLHVSDLSKAVPFYTEGLGLDIVSRVGESAVFMSSSQYHHHIAINIWNGAGAPQPEAGSVGLKSFTLSYPNQDTLDAATARLEKMGYEVFEEDGLTVTQDPSGNRVGIISN
ncbi:VOC family protein [Salinicoccus sesuvii]|uniref:VOC family protein n=1 Tax=Salinicoccus sesuvii TaxID=868281 RepID=A0ABV7N3B5_9STAP